MFVCVDVCACRCVCVFLFVCVCARVYVPTCVSCLSVCVRACVNLSAGI